MIKENIFERYLDALLRGNKKGARAIIEETLQNGIPTNSVYVDIIWPVMIEIEKLLRSGHITPVQEHLATRINRTIVDQLQNKLPCRANRDKKIVICCAPDELKELGAQMMADLFESDGWEVKFLGGGLNSDDILAFVNENGPDILLIYGTEPKQAPSVRLMIDAIKNVNAWPDMLIMLSGGLFNRAEGLWAEMGADLFAATAVEAVQAASDDRWAETHQDGTIHRRKKRQRVTKEAVGITSKAGG